MGEGILGLDEPIPAARLDARSSGVPIVRLPDGCSPWSHATSVDGRATTSARGAAWLGDTLLTREQLADLVAGLACGVPPERRLDELVRLCRELNGAWALVVRWADGDALAAVDRLRSLPLFYGRLPDGGPVVSCAVAELADCAGASALDREAAVEFLLSGYVMDSRTLHPGISQVQPGEVAYWHTGDLSLRRHYRFVHAEPREDSLENLTATLHATMDEVFARLERQFAGRRIIVPLSGGLDSRLIAAMLRRHGHRDVVALTYGRPGSLEAETSRAVAEALHIPWEFVPYEEGDWQPLVSATAMREFWRYAGQEASLPHLQDYLALHRLRQRDPGMDAVFFPGYVGDMIAGAWTLRPDLFRLLAIAAPMHLPHTDGPLDLRAVRESIVALRYRQWPARRQEIEAIERRVNAFLGEADFAAGGGSPAAFDLFEFENRQARYLANAVRSLEYFGFDWWLPLCDSALMDFFLTVPVPARELKRLYALWMRDGVFVGNMSRLAEIPPIGDGRYTWGRVPPADLRTSVRMWARSRARVAGSLEPRFVQRRRTRAALQRFAAPDLRFHEWFADGDSNAQSTTLGDLIRDGGALSGLPSYLTGRFRAREAHAVCLISPLALLAAAYLAEVSRSQVTRT